MRGIIFAFLLSTTPMASAAESTGVSWWEQYLTPTEAEIDVVTELQGFEPLNQQIVDDCVPPRLKSDEPSIEDQFNSIVAIGEKIWKMIEAGKPVVNYKTAPLAHALPYNTICWTELENWRRPASQVREVTYKNALGINVVKFRYRVTYSPGGSYFGDGSYLANVTVLPESLDVAWLYNFDAETTVGRALNAGTRDNPIAALQLMVTWNVRTMVKSTTASDSFFVRGDE